jgi:hypothetical protein
LSPTFDHRNPEMAIVVQKIAIAFIANNKVNVNETRRADTRMTSAEYDGDNPLRLANEIDAALAKYGLGNDHRMCKAIHFFEGELRLIAECRDEVLGLLEKGLGCTVA